MKVEFKCRIISKPVDYGRMLKIQENKREEVISGKSYGTVFFLEHNPVYTLGLRGSTLHFIEKFNVPVYRVKRGGEVTWHGPGQLIVYPVINIKHTGFYSVRDFVQYFGNIIADVMVQDYGLKKAEWIDKKAGVWIEDRKIAFSGLHFRKFVPTHGFSINVSSDTVAYKKIIPCGIKSLKVTSMELEGNRVYNTVDVAEKIILRIKRRFSKMQTVRKDI